MGHKIKNHFGFFEPLLGSIIGFIIALVVLFLVRILNIFVRSETLGTLIDLIRGQLLLFFAISLALGYGSSLATDRTLAPTAPLVSSLGATLITILVLSILDSILPTGSAFTGFSRAISDNIIVVFGVFASAGYVGFLMQTVRK